VTWSDPAAGQTLTAAKLVELATYAVPISAVKTSNTSRFSTTTPTADPELSIVLPANRTYVIEVVQHVTSDANAAGDYRVSYTWTNTATVTDAGIALANTLASGTQGSIEAVAHGADSTSPSSDINYGASTSRNTFVQWLRVVTGGSDVTFSLQWAQQTSSVSNTNLLAGSQMTAQRVDN
jgi:hypothetical protein